jgi:hypothetical protein
MKRKLNTSDEEVKKQKLNYNKSPSIALYGKEIVTNAKFSDITVRVNDHLEFKLHRVLLARSSYFSATWFQDESIDFIDLSQEVPYVATYETWKQLFYYIYTESVDLSSLNAEQIMIFAQLVLYFHLETEPVVNACRDNNLTQINVMNIFGRLHSQLEDISDQDQQRLFHFVKSYYTISTIVLAEKNNKKENKMIIKALESFVCISQPLMQIQNSINIEINFIVFVD